MSLDTFEFPRRGGGETDSVLSTRSVPSALTSTDRLYLSSTRTHSFVHILYQMCYLNSSFRRKRPFH